MGSTFSTIQIRNPHPPDSEQFMKQLCKYFEKKGLVATTEQDAQFSYWIAFSADGNWATMGSSGYDSSAANTDVEEIAKSLKTYCLLTSVWDSDFFEIKLFGSTVKLKDVIVGGEPYYEGERLEGNRELWEPLLASNKTWEQLTEICNGSYTFAEDALCEVVSLLGINPENVTSNYSCSEEISTNIPSVIDLYFNKVHIDYFKRDSFSASNVINFNFKKTQHISIKANKNSSSLKTVFKQVFGERLEPLGFTKIKGRQTYFVRLIGDEVLHVLAYANESPQTPGYKEFNVLGGVATVYRQRIALDDSPHNNTRWLMSNLDYYRKSNPFESKEIDSIMFNKLYRYSYKMDDDESLLCGVKYSLKMTEEFMLPVLNAVVDLKSCVEYFTKYCLNLNIPSDVEPFGNNNPNNIHTEGLLLVKTNTRKKWANLYEILDNPDKYAKALAELERRKLANRGILRSYGLIFQ